MTDVAPSVAARLPSLSAPDNRRASVFRLLAILTFGALITLAASAVFIFGRLGDGTRQFEAEMVGEHWQQRNRTYAATLGVLARQDGAGRHLRERDERWLKQAMADPLRSMTGASHVALALEKASNTPPVLVRMIGGAAQIEWRSPLPGDARSMVVARAPIDAPLLRRLGASHGLHAIELRSIGTPLPGESTLALNGADGAPVAMLVWHSATPVAQWRHDILWTLALVLGVFGACALVVLQRSSHIANDLIASEARARHLAYHDVLTGLPNRAMMFDRLRQMLALGRRYYGEVAVHCLDLDRFKEVNDSLGHPAGDELIRQVSERLVSLCRDSDTVARLGGDEFVILQPETNAAGASHLAERVLRMFEEPFELEYGVVEVGVSIGVTLTSNPDIDPNEALRQADLALYGSKEGGRGRITFFEPDMDAALRMRRNLENDLRQAISEGSLDIVYQPQMDARGTISAMEALLRWTHPEKGPIQPSVFVPLCEETGLILDLGEFVFERVFSETQHWLNMRISINVSPVQLRSPVFMAVLTRLVAKYRIEPARYEIEITEAALRGDDNVTRDNLLMLKQEGFTIALDDFGTGYSSVNALRRFDIDKIKIDRSFVHSIEADDEAEALVDAMVKLGRAMRLAIVAEGVETDEQRDRLSACGCNQFQGFLVSRPIPAAQLDGLFYG